MPEEIDALARRPAATASRCSCGATPTISTDRRARGRGHAARWSVCRSAARVRRQPLADRRRAQQQPHGLAGAGRAAGSFRAADLGAIQARQRLERCEPERTETVRAAPSTLRVALPLPGVSLHRDPPRELTTTTPLPRSPRMPTSKPLPPQIEQFLHDNPQGVLPRSGGTGCRSSASSPCTRATAGWASPSPRPGRSSRICCGTRAARC